MPTDTDRQGQWLRGVLDLVVLAVLDREGEAWGYALQGLLADAGLPDIKGGTLYPLLTRLEKDGLLTATWRSGESGPPRKFFSVTAAGRDVLAHGTPGWLDFSATVTSVLAPRTRALRRVR